MDLPILILLFVLGCCVGSFCNVLIYRIPKEEEFVRTPSHCMTCGHNLRWFELIPVVKLMTVRSASATFCRTLSLLLGSGLSLTDSLDLVAMNMGNIWFKEAVQTIRAMIAEGWSLNASMRDTGLFPPMVYNLVGIGEETGDLQGMLTKTADYYDEEVQDSTAKLLSLMEPAIMLFLAVFVVILVLAIFLPMLNMTKAYDKYL